MFHQQTLVATRTVARLSTIKSEQARRKYGLCCCCCCCCCFERSWQCNLTSSETADHSDRDTPKMVVGDEFGRLYQWTLAGAAVAVSATLVLVALHELEL